jgi:hypothetical protein
VDAEVEVSLFQLEEFGDFSSKFFERFHGVAKVDEI